MPISSTRLPLIAGVFKICDRRLMVSAGSQKTVSMIATSCINGGTASQRTMPGNEGIDGDGDSTELSDDSSTIDFSAGKGFDGREFGTVGFEHPANSTTITIKGDLAPRKNARSWFHGSNISLRRHGFILTNTLTLARALPSVYRKASELHQWSAERFGQGQI